MSGPARHARPRPWGRWLAVTALAVAVTAALVLGAACVITG